jgi:hypothetical protein
MFPGICSGICAATWAAAWPAEGEWSLEPAFPIAIAPAMVPGVPCLPTEGMTQNIPLAASQN